MLRTLRSSAAIVPAAMMMRIGAAPLSLNGRLCSTHEGQGDVEVPLPKLVKRRARRSLDDDDYIQDATDSLLQDGDGGEHHRMAAATQHRVEPLVMRRMDPSLQSRRAGDDDDDVGDDDDSGDVVGGGGPMVDPLLAADASGHPTGESDQPPPDSDGASSSPILAYLAYFEPWLQHANNRCVQMPMAELIDAVTAYLRASENPRVVSEREEAFLFPALVQRLSEATVPMLLQVVEQHWARSTLVRHGTFFKDIVRDRIAADASELSADLVLQSVVVMGMSAGRRKRDLEFFQVLGRLFMVHVNAYKNPADLVRVLTAFARAKIVPPPSFLALMGRRLQVLCKTTPLPPLAAYRAFVNLYKMGHDQMNAYRFLADRMFETIEDLVKQEKTRIRTQALLRQRTLSIGRNADATAPSPSSMSGAAADPAAPNATTSSSEAPPTINPSGVGSDQPHADASGGDLSSEMSSSLLAKRRFAALTGGLKPSHVTKLLMILARFGAPHQQYLRPLIQPLIVPHLEHMPPPTFTRLLRLMRLFVTTDAALIVPVLDRLIALGPANALLPDILEALRLLSLRDVPMMPNLDGFITLCVAVFGDQARLRAGDMCAVASDLLLIQRKEDIPLGSVERLCGLMDCFAARMTFLIHLGVLSLTHAEALEDMCRMMHHPDAQGKVQELSETRRRINHDAGGDDAYYMAIDVDVRETFHKAQIFNNWNTYGSFRPLPGVLQVDFQQALTEVSAECILETAHLFELAYPGKMIVPLQRLMAKAFLAKLSDEGEWVIAPDDPFLLTARKSEEILFTRETLKAFTNRVLATPLKRVRGSAAVWSLIAKKSERLKLSDVHQLAQSELCALALANATGAAGPS